MNEEEATDRTASVDGVKIVNGHPFLEIPPVTWWKSPGLRHLYVTIPILFLGSTINGYDGSLLNGLQTMPQWREYFNEPSGARLGLFTAIQNIGGIAALPLSPYAADWFGRRIGVEIGIILIFVGVIVQAVPGANSGMYIGGRFLLGFGSNFSQGCAPLLIIEVCETTAKVAAQYDSRVLAACPSSTSRRHHDHVQYPLVRWIDHSSMDSLRNDRIQRQCFVEDSGLVAGSHAVRPVRWHLAPARKSKVAVFQRPRRRCDEGASQGQYTRATSYLEQG